MLLQSVRHLRQRVRRVNAVSRFLYSAANVGDAEAPVAAAAAPVAKQASAPAPPTTTWQSIVVGEIVDLQRHPEADRLNVCQVNVGDSENLLQIICGAPNARQGARVPVATVGSKLAIKEPSSGELYVVPSLLFFLDRHCAHETMFLSPSTESSSRSRSRSCVARSRRA
ncbi:hypothetical protein PINS_up019769 [Pythium insidiosum]|nr:hypothetical protein PINS_up019769 [Pythium insidiosum]